MRTLLPKLTLSLMITLTARLLPGQTAIYPAAPQDSLKPGTSFRYSDLGLASGVIWDERAQNFFYRDFAIVIFRPGDGTASIDVRLTDDLGLDYRYQRDNLGAPLVIDGKAEKKTVLLNVAGVAFPVNDIQHEYHPNITVEITSNEPVVVIPVGQFSAMGHGSTVEEAIENGWQNFGFAVPSLVQGKYRYFPYAIFWRNLCAFPDGWDTKISLTNKTGSPKQVQLRYVPDYHFVYDPATVTARDGGRTVPIDLICGPDETLVVYLHDLLGTQLESSYQTEGSLVLESSTFNPSSLQWEGTDLEITVEVMPLSRGSRVCARPRPFNERPSRRARR